MGRMIPIGLVARLGVGLPVAPGEENRQRHDRHDDEEHQPGRVDEEIALLGCDIAGWVEHHGLAAAEHGEQRQQEDGANTVQEQFQSMTRLTHRPIGIRTAAAGVLDNLPNAPRRRCRTRVLASTRHLGAAASL